MGTKASLLAHTLGLTIMALGVTALLTGAAQAKTITQIIDSNGDGGGNTLIRPTGVAVDSSGNVYITGQFTDNAFQIDPNGTITEIIDSTGDGGGNTLDSTRSVAVDGSGNVYVTGSNSSNAFKIEPGGSITEIIDSTGDGGGNTFGFPFGVAVDGSGNVYVTSFYDNAFQIDPNGEITQIIDSTGDGGGNTLDGTFRVAVDGSGNVYVSGYGSDNAFQIDPNGAITEIIDRTGDGGGNTLNSPAGVAVDGSGSVYIAGFATDNVFKIDPNGAITEIIDRTGDGGGNTLLFPLGVAVDGSGNVYVTGRSSDNAFKIEPGGSISEIIDATGDGAGNPLDSPVGVAVDGSGSVYVTGSYSHNVFKIQFCGDGLPAPDEECDDGNNDNGDGCSAYCRIEDCLATPLMGCLSPGGSGKSQLQIKNQKPAGPSSKDKIQWKWLKGPELTQADFGDPTDPNDTDFKLCLYVGAAPSLIVEMQVPAGGTCETKPCWKPVSTKGYQYGDKLLTSDGVKKLILKGGVAGKSKILIQGKDGNLPLPRLPLDPNGPVIAQLISSDPNLPCYEAIFPQANVTKNEAKQFKAKTP